MKREALLILGDQLFPQSYLQKFKGFPCFMAEDESLCRHFRYHKKKLVLFLSAMRHFQEENLKILKFDYHELSERGSYFEKLSTFVRKNKITDLHHFEIEDKFFEDDFLVWAKRNRMRLQSHPSPSFLVSRVDFVKYLKNNKRPFQKTFYEWQRKEKNILLTSEGLPLGGVWSHDLKNRKPYKEKKTPPRISWFESDPLTTKVSGVVEKHFPNHPGKTAGFAYPVTRTQALEWLDQFCTERLDKFGPYEDAIHSEEKFLFHSILSPVLNLGLVTPAEVLNRVLEISAKKNLPLESVEGFVRQVLGWREFVRGIYRNYSEEQEVANFWNHKQRLRDCWYLGTTGILPLDDTIRKVEEWAYAHHIERLMIVGNMMLLCEVDPREVHRWFMEMFVDSADWVMGPNVYGMALMSDGGIFATKPYICGSNYWLKMSNYRKGQWSTIVDALYWNFIAKNKSFFVRNYRTSMMVKLLDKKTPAQLRLYRQTAEKFIEEVTLPPTRT